MAPPSPVAARYIELGIRYAVALIFLASALGKMVFGSVVTTLFLLTATQEVLSPSLAKAGVMILTAAEGIVALGLLVRPHCLAFYRVGLALCGASIVGLFLAGTQDCGCFGDVLVLGVREHRGLVLTLSTLVFVGWIMAGRLTKVGS